MSSLLPRIPQQFWACCALLLWGALSFLLLHKTVYGIDEGAAHALLLAWTVADSVVSPVVTLGLPDFRAVILAPVGYLWTGNVVAAKIATLVVMAVAVWALHAWRQRTGESESALLATGLLLISPLVLDQMDSISVATYLLFTFVLGAWADQQYRQSPQAFGGMYFAQLFLCLVSVTLHPAGLAYPLALLWSWYTSPLDKKQQKYFLWGITSTVLLAFILTLGWHNVEWFGNPIKGMANLLLGLTSEKISTARWLAGIGALLVLLLVIFKQAGQLWSDFLGRILLVSLAFGVLAGDEVFSLIALVICLYWGLPLVLGSGRNTHGGFWRQRGLALALLVIMATTYMSIDKSRYPSLLADTLSPSDNLIRAMTNNVENIVKDGQQGNEKSTPLRIASQWPARTMLACRCDALPLPPDAKDEQTLLKMLHGISYLMFDPRDRKNVSLSHNLALMGGQVETISLQQGGIIVEIKAPPPTPKSS